MKFIVVALYDNKVCSYSHVQNFRRKDEAVRTFSEAIDDVNSPMHKYAEDFSLFEIGYYDDETGLHIPHQVPILIITALNASKFHRDYYAKISLDYDKSLVSNL